MEICWSVLLPYTIFDIFRVLGFFASVTRLQQFNKYSSFIHTTSSSLLRSKTVNHSTEDQILLVKIAKYIPGRFLDVL